jgi:hypothetical protein
MPSGVVEGCVLVGMPAVPNRRAIILVYSFQQSAVRKKRSAISVQLSALKKSQISKEATDYQITNRKRGERRALDAEDGFGKITGGMLDIRVKPEYGLNDDIGCSSFNNRIQLQSRKRDRHVAPGRSSR